MRVTHLLAVAAAALLLGATAPAFAADTFIPGTGYASFAGNGDSGLDAFGNTWSWNSTPTAIGASSWGTPGLGAGSASYGSQTAATDFQVVFNGTPVPMIDTTPSPGRGGYNEFTRFEVSDPVRGQVEWTPVYSGTNTVTFYAPAGTSLAAGATYFVNIIFDGATLNGNNTGFAAQFSVAGAPGPTPGAGFAGLAVFALAGLYTRARRA